jgi:hypothetical protein
MNENVIEKKGINKLDDIDYLAFDKEMSWSLHNSSMLLRRRSTKREREREREREKEKAKDWYIWILKCFYYSYFPFLSMVFDHN